MNPDSPVMLLYRLDRLEADVRKLDEDKAEAKDVARLADEMRGVKRMLGAFTLALVVAALSFAFWAAQVVVG